MEKETGTNSKTKEGLDIVALLVSSLLMFGFMIGISVTMLYLFLVVSVGISSIPVTTTLLMGLGSLVAIVVISFYLKLSYTNFANKHKS